MDNLKPRKRRFPNSPQIRPQPSPGTEIMPVLSLSPAISFPGINVSNGNYISEDEDGIEIDDITPKFKAFKL